MRESGERRVVVLGFLLLVAGFRLKEEFERDDLKRLWEIVDQHRLAPQLRFELDLFEECEGMIMGAVGSTVYYNVKLRHSTLDMPIIDYDLAVLLQPMLMLGISIGVTFNVIFADWMVTVLLIILFLTAALNGMFTSMNSPSQLTGWTASGGDPCGQSWKGVTCSGSKVTQIKIPNLGLTGSIGYSLQNLQSVTDFDLSHNNFGGTVPYNLPPNVVRLNLASCNFNGGLPYSISLMKSLKELDLS